MTYGAGHVVTMFYLMNLGFDLKLLNRYYVEFVFSEILALETSLLDLVSPIVLYHLILFSNGG